VAQPKSLLDAVGRKLGVVPRSAMLSSRNPVVRELAQLAYGAKLLASVRRTRWLLDRKAIPPIPIGCRAPKPVDESQVELCERLIAAYRSARQLQPDADPSGGRWAWIFGHRQQELVTALDRGDATALAEMMSSMFVEDFVLGYAPGLPLVRRSDSRLGARAWGLKCLDGLASLAEVLGAAPVENPERGSIAPAFAEGLPALLSGIEAELGFAVDVPAHGAPCGLEVGERIITPDTPEQIYAAVRLKEAISLSSSHLGRSPGRCRTVEVGGGYGGLCYWFLRQGDIPAVDSYTIVDLPVANVVQGYFLSNALGRERVSLYGEPPASVRIVPNLALSEVSTPVEVMVNKDGLPEMPHEAMMEYLRWATENCEMLLYSYNQEAAVQAEWDSQGVVHDAVAELGGFDRLTRSKSWLRDGYVEEIYARR
jgi:hypothetical protein